MNFYLFIEVKKVGDALVHVYDSDWEEIFANWPFSAFF